MARHVAIDIETSGLDPHVGHEMIRFCAVELMDNGKLGSRYQSLIRPKKPLSVLATDLTGLDNKMLAKAPSFSKVAPLVSHFIQDAVLISTNAAFERTFLNAALASVGLPVLPSSQFLDLQTKLPKELKERGTDGIYQFLGTNRIATDRPSEEVARLYLALV